MQTATSYEPQNTLRWRRKIAQRWFVTKHGDLQYRNELMFTDVLWIPLSNVSSTVQTAVRKVLSLSQSEPISKYADTQVPHLNPRWDLLGLRTQVFCEILENAVSQHLIPMSLKDLRYNGLATSPFFFCCPFSDYTQISRKISKPLRVYSDATPPLFLTGHSFDLIRWDPIQVNLLGERNFIVLRNEHCEIWSANSEVWFTDTERVTKTYHGKHCKPQES